MIKGFLAGSFDVIHPGYIHMFKESKSQCDYLIVGLHIDPTIERPEKIQPILSYEDRREILLSIRYIDEVIPYALESDLIQLMKDINPSIRFLGDDYRGKKITGDYLGIPIHYINRDHEWSTTKFKRLIKYGKNLQ
jgi:glycerol-3-phosphate cytidylyltransferase